MNFKSYFLLEKQELDFSPETLNSLKKLITHKLYSDPRKGWSEDPRSANWLNTIAAVIYGMITNSPHNPLNSPELYKQWNMHRKEYENNLDAAAAYYKPAKRSDAWIQWDLSPRTQNDTTKNNLNLYFTFTKTPENILHFTKKLPDIIGNLYNKSKEFNSRISFKTHNHFPTLLHHNDTFKVYFNNPDIKDDLLAYMNKLFNTLGIKTEKRSHTFGQDTGGQSYGIRLAVNVENWIKGLDQKGYTPDQIIQVMQQYKDKLFQDIAV